MGKQYENIWEMSIRKKYRKGVWERNIRKECVNEYKKGEFEESKEILSIVF